MYAGLVRKYRLVVLDEERTGEVGKLFGYFIRAWCLAKLTRLYKITSSEMPCICELTSGLSVMEMSHR